MCHQVQEAAHSAKDREGATRTCVGCLARAGEYPGHAGDYGDVAGASFEHPRENGLCEADGAEGVERKHLLVDLQSQSASGKAVNAELSPNPIQYTLNPRTMMMGDGPALRSWSQQ